MLAMQTMKRYMGFISLVVVFLLILSTEARSEIYGFEAISNNSGVSGALASQLCVDVTEYGTNQVLFTFFNNGLAPYQVPSPIPSTIRLVVFDDGALLGPPDVIEGPGVVGFTEIGSEDEKVLPGGNGPPYYFQTTAGFGALADPSPAFNGVDEWDPSGSPPNPVEFVGIVFEIGGGYDFHVNEWTVTPTTSFQYICYHNESFKETGAGAAGLNVDAATSHSLRSKLGVTLSTVTELYETKVVPELFVGWAHEFIDDEDIKARFVEGTAKFTTDVDDDWDDSVYFGAGISTLLKENISAFVRYEGEHSSGKSINALHVGITVLF